MAKLIVKDLPAEEVILNSEATVEIVGGVKTGLASGSSPDDNLSPSGNFSYYHSSTNPNDAKYETFSFPFNDTAWMTL